MLGLSPNNLKFSISQEEGCKLNKLSHFYLIIIDEDKINIFYYWVVNDIEKINILENEFRNSQNLKELIENMKNHLGDSNYISNLERIFKIKN